MFKSYLTIALRNLRRHKGYSLINILGLTVGMTSFLLIMLYVLHELSYDRYHQNAKRIHRIVSTCARTPIPIAPALAAEVPGIARTARIWQSYSATIRVGDEVFMETMYLADPAFFEIFSFDFVKGEAKTALNNPTDVVLTESAAKKYFGTTEAMGRTLNIPFDHQFVALTVTGIIRDIPENSHFKFAYMGAFALFARNSVNMDNWSNSLIYAYLLLEEGVSAQQIEAQLPALMKKHVDHDTDIYRLQPLLEIHLKSPRLTFEIAPQGNLTYVLIFAAIAMIIVLLACINFMNLATARSAKRAMEVGIRKVCGGHRRQLRGQFLGEALLISGLAMVLAVIMAELLLPVFRNLTEQNLALDFIAPPELALALVALTVLVGALAGSYPAFYLSAIQPVHMLKTKSGPRAGGRGLRHALVVFQFCASLILIIGTLTIRQQIDFIKNKPLGFDKEHIVVLHYGHGLGPRLATAKSELLQSPHVVSVAAALTMPGDVNTYTMPFGLEGMPANAPESELLEWATDLVDFDFIATMGMAIKEGRTFQRGMATDSSAFVINEAAVKSAVAKLGEVWRSPVGKWLDYFTSYHAGWRIHKSGPVIGVVRDFNYRSLHHEVGPMALQIGPQALFLLVVKIKGDHVGEALALLEDKWKKLFPDHPFNFHFLDENLGRQYHAEKKAEQIIMALTFWAIFIACLRLFGLAAFMAELRTKEIGMREVLGASVTIILGLLSKDFVKLLLLANLAAWPLAYYAANAWLRNFTHRITLDWLTFVAAAALTTMIALLTIGYQILRSASTNPMEALRYE